MLDLDQLRNLADQVTAPPFDAISSAGDRRDRRRAAMVATVAVSTIGLVIATVALVRGPDATTPEPVRPPITSPTPAKESRTPETSRPQSLDSMTPEEVVNDPGAELEAVAMAPGDPDMRVSTWHALCSWCPARPDGRGGVLGPPTFAGMALTNDGYETATYVRHPFSGLGGDLRSVRDDVFLYVDSSNGREWVIGLDGDVRRVQRITEELRPSDPRLWFECGRAGGIVTNWCSLDPDTATAHVWPAEWDRSAVSPDSGEQPWGWTPFGGTWEHPGGVVEAWWYESGIRQSRTLATDAMGGTLAGSPAGDLAYWTWRPGSDTVDLHTGHDRGASWDVETRSAPTFNRWVRMARSPDGALLAWTYWPHLVVWRADASDGDFERVLETPASELGSSVVMIQHGLVYASGSGVSAVSEDDGLTWTTVETWR